MSKTKYRKVDVSEALFNTVTMLFNNKPLKINDGCIEWTMCINQCGYGVLRHNGIVQRAHRFIYPLYHKVEIGDFHVLHKCDNPKCVNPEHLFLGTIKDNAQDKMKKGRSKTGKSSKYRYVIYRKDSGKWRVVTTMNGKNISHGQFNTEDEAGKYVEDNILQSLKQPYFSNEAKTD